VIDPSELAIEVFCDSRVINFLEEKLEEFSSDPDVAYHWLRDGLVYDPLNKTVYFTSKESAQAFKHCFPDWATRSVEPVKKGKCYRGVEPTESVVCVSSLGSLQKGRDESLQEVRLS
jgi:hypothetical protein